MKNFTSNKIIEDMGGLEGLEEKLKTNRNVRLNRFRTEYQPMQRIKKIELKNMGKPIPL